MIGRTLSHFRIVEKLGEGGMGVVYRAEDTSLRRPVALKVLPPELVANEERRLRFLREARAAAAVTHPNIATVYEVGEAPADSGGGPGIVFIAMELVEGRTLREVIGGRAMPVKEALRVATEMAEGMAAAHQANIVHRDLKPENVVLAAGGRVKILDFGLAKLLEPRAGRRPEGGGGVGAGAGGAADGEMSRLETLSGEMTQAGRILGTAAYMSPEQARGEAVDARSDLFSFGIILYEMAAGTAPFQGRTPTDLLSAIIKDRPAPLSELNPEAPGELGRMVEKCLEKEPRDRYQHADDLATDLRRLQRQLDSAALPAQRAAVAQRGAAAQRRAAVQGEGVSRRILRSVIGRPALVGALAAVVALAVWLNGPSSPLRRMGGGSAGRIDSLAVLPLRNLSGDPEQEYFADGMTEELTATLARIRALKVISSTSAMYYKGKQKPLREIAAELDVKALVEGSVMRSGDRVRVTAQLVEGATDRHLWAQSYERDLRDVLALQADVARAIAAEVEAALTPGEAARLSETRPVDPEAYEHYLAGQHLLSRLTKAGITRATEEFERAIEEDPNYAPAHAGLGRTYLIMADFSVAPPREVYPKARAAVLRALEIDPLLAEGHLALGNLKRLERDWAGAEAEFRKAIELNPSSAMTHFNFAGFLMFLDRPEDALAELRQVERFDPLSPEARLYGGIAYWLAGRYDESLAQFERLLELHPDYGPGKDSIATLYVDMGRHEEGIAALRERVRSPDAEVPWAMAYLVRAYTLAGRKPEARELLSELLRLSESSYVPPTYVAIGFASLGDPNAAFDWLDKALEERDPMLGWLNAGQWWGPLRSDPRFADLLRRAGFPGD